ncbi:hypothetical protein PHABIO_122 [Pseudomonas phage Phabio]|uniref:Uncharacterized protein n=1 Tax=Pseudomonas phage Phabio TaxID=2006668 RepID=A0A1Y0SYE0_9CAUD|nr:hypothetical protein MZD05_gp122 [Pseudomonas phage Phabio]ARV76753.1 hypothetical protein PHABIO_122 [Pseudomonas phage Phabio]
MEPSIIPNAHECAHLSPPTDEDNRRIDAALNTIFNKGTNAMTEQTTVALTDITEETPITFDHLEQVAADTEKAATEMLRQDGWSIVTEMQKALLKGINSTSLVVLPVQGNLELVKSKVSDPEGFSKIMSTLTFDIGQLIEASTLLSDQHVEKKGAVADEDFALVQKVAFGYSELQGYLERAIQPLVVQVADILEAAGITELEIK